MLHQTTRTSGQSLAAYPHLPLLVAAFLDHLRDLSKSQMSMSLEDLMELAQKHGAAATKESEQCTVRGSDRLRSAIP